MSELKCRTDGRLSSLLLLLDLKRCNILKVWYEGSWDVLQTRDLIVEETQEYRANPRSYLQSQIGIR